MFFVYVIWNQERDKIYIGQTAHLEDRIKRHNGLLKNKPRSFTSKNSGFWLLVYREECPTRQDALRREKELKSFRGRELVKTIIRQRISSSGAPIA